MTGSTGLQPIDLAIFERKKMKYFLLLLSIITLACSAPESDNANEEKTTMEEPEVVFAFYGDTITTGGANAMADVAQMVSETGTVNAKIEGTITSCCQKKGCWMKMDVAGYNEPIRVTFKDYGFFVPLNSASNWAVVEGKAYLDTTSVETLRHYAEDAGKTEEEILAIDQPEVTISFEAHGVAIKESEVSAEG